ncbi:MAG: YkgJ family cysteine cluster protein [Burkholderiales bacterium]|nr:YkgJ family cysteine cluster protein [Burkholderiales bacterium]
MNSFRDNLSPEEQAHLVTVQGKVKQVFLRRLQAPEWSVISFVAEWNRAQDDIGLANQGEGVELACRAGCSHCCHASVEIFSPEAFAIVRTLKTLPADRLSAIRQRLLEYELDNIDDPAWTKRPACPFLDDHRCSIYAVRPVACRQAHSLDVKACENDAPHIPQSLNLLAGMSALSGGVMDALAVKGLDTAAYDFVPAVLLALDDPGCEERWLAGERVFSPVT